MDFLKSQNQFVNTLMFPGAFQKSSYSTATFKHSKSLRLIFIPFKTDLCSNNFSYINAAPSHVQALLYVNNHPKCSTICIHFHGNACDIGQIKVCAEREAISFNCHYLSVEFPRFGLCDGHPNEVVLNEVATIAHNFVVNDLKIPHGRIILSGRSVGSGIVCTLAARLETEHMQVAAVVLQSPYASIRDAAGDLLGCISFFMLNRWDNAQHLVGSHEGVIKSPVFFMHADQDKVIDCNHSRLLFEHRKKHNLPCEFFLQESTSTFVKGHNFFDYVHDVVLPTKAFLGRYVEAPDSRFGNTSFTMPMEVVDKVSKVPAQYESEIITDHLDADAGTHPTITRARSSFDENEDAKSIFRNPKCHWSIWCGFACCPCVMCSEGCVAVNYMCCKKGYYCVSGTQPVFEYGLLRPASTKGGSICNLLRRKNSFDEIEANRSKINNPTNVSATSASAAPGTKADLIGRTASTKPGKRTSKTKEIINPLLIGNFDDLSNVDANLQKNAITATCPVSYDADDSTAPIEVNFVPG